MSCIAESDREEGCRLASFRISARLLQGVKNSAAVLISLELGNQETEGQLLTTGTSVESKLCSKMAEGIQELVYLRRNLLLVV
jgi:hypothetical protein